MRFRIRLPLSWTLVATLFAVAISSAGGQTTTATTSKTRKSGPTTSTPYREENLARMIELRNITEHLRGQLLVKQERQSTLNGEKDWEKKQADARDEWQNATEEVDMSEKRKNKSREAVDNATEAKNIKQAKRDQALGEWETANVTLLNSTTLLEKDIKDYNYANFSDIDSITEESLETVKLKLDGLAQSQTMAVQKQDGPGDKNHLEQLQSTLNNTLKKRQALSGLTACWRSYRGARSEQRSKERSVNQAVLLVNIEIARREVEAAQLTQRTNELNDAKGKAKSARLTLKSVEADVIEWKRLPGEILVLTEELNQAKDELFRLEELTRTPSPPQTGKKTQGANSIPSGRLDRKAFDAYQERYRSRPRDPDRPWRFLCKANGCDNNASDMLVIFIGLGSFYSSLLLAQRVYYCWEEATHCFERCQRDEVVKNGKEAREEKRQRKLDDANCSAELRKRYTRVATTSAKSTKPPAKC